MRHDQAHGAIVLVLDEVLVGVDPVVAIVQGFHPVVVQLKVPVLAFWRHDFYQQGLVSRDCPMAVVVGDVGISAGGERHLRIEPG